MKVLQERNIVIEKHSRAVADLGIYKPGSGPGAVKFLRSWDCFDDPSQIPYAFVVRL